MEISRRTTTSQAICACVHRPYINQKFPTHPSDRPSPLAHPPTPYLYLGGPLVPFHPAKGIVILQQPNSPGHVLQELFPQVGRRVWPARLRCRPRGILRTGGARTLQHGCCSLADETETGYHPVRAALATSQGRVFGSPAQTAGKLFKLSRSGP